jgi:uroporphyrinogen-III synthase
MRVLVTRPIEDAEATAALLRARGHEPVIAPLLDIRYREGEAVSLDGVQAILATSANGVRALSRCTSRREVKILTVGAQTAEAARAADFLDVRNADGDASDLIQLVIDTLDQNAGALLHAAGSETRGDVAGTLRRAGFSVHVVALYDAIAAKALTADLSRIDTALFYSPRSAAIFAELARGVNCSRIRACCISAATADALKPLRFREIRMADRPNQDRLLALLD